MEIKREKYLEMLINRKHNGLIKVITGIRRCGKSYLLNEIFYNHLIDTGVNKNHIIQLAFDTDEHTELLDYKVLGEYIRSKLVDDEMYYVLLDEIQEVRDFEKVLNGLLRKKNVDVYVTGSNSKFLSSDIITEFGGRGDEIKVYPLSFNEFYSVYNGNKDDALKEYMTYGGLPLILSYQKEEDKIKYLNTQKKSVYIRDVIKRNSIQKEEEISKLVEIISSSIGSLTNPLKLSNTFKSFNKNSTLTDKTIHNYLTHLENAYLIESTHRYDVKGKKYIETPKKYYFCDIGIRNSFINFRQQEETHIMENIIYMELKRRGYDVDIGVVKIKDDSTGTRKVKSLEIDFIANKGNNKIYIQSTLSIDNENKKLQEERSLVNVNDFF